MAYFNPEAYGPQKSAADVTEGINSLGDALTDVLNRRQKAKQADDQLAFEREDAQRKFAQNQGNLDYQNRIISQRDKRDQLTFNQGQEAHKSDAIIKAAQARAAGNPQLADAIMHGTVTYDPATGAETGRGEIVPGPMKDIGPAPEAPVAPEAPQGVPPEIAARRRGRTSTSVDENDIYQRQGMPMPPPASVSDPTESFGRPKNFIPSGLTLTSDEGPVEPQLGGPPASPAPGSVESRGFSPQVQSSREQATSDMVAEEQARMDQQQYAGQKSAFDAASAAYPGERARYDLERKQAQGEQPFTARFGASDPGVTFTPEALRYGQRHAVADDFAASMRGVPLDERGKANVASALAMLEAGQDPKVVYAQFDRAQGSGEQMNFKHGEGLLRDAAAQKRAETIAAGRAQGLDPKSANFISEIHEREAGGTRQDWKTVEDDLEKWGKGVAGLPLQGKSYPRLTMALKNINSGNGPLQRDAQSALVSYFSGGGVVRKFEQEFLLSHLAGLGAQGETAIEHIQSGRLGPTDLAVMQEATRRALTEQKERAAELDDAAKGFGPGSGYDNFGGNIDRWMQTRLKAIGYDHEPLYAGQSAAVLGTTDRPYMHKHPAAPAGPPAARPPGAPPEVKARDKALKKKAVDDALGALGG